MQRVVAKISFLLPQIATGAAFIALLLISLRSSALAIWLAPVHLSALSHGLVLDAVLDAAGVRSGAIEVWLAIVYLLLSLPFIAAAESMSRFSSTSPWRRAIATWIVFIVVVTVLAALMGSLGFGVE